MQKRWSKIIVCWLLFNFTLASAEGVASEQFQQGIDAFAKGDYITAAEYWLVEAYEGSVEAQFSLGVLYLEGKGVRKSREDAISWFAKAAQRGHIEAQYNLGHLLMEEQDNPKSVQAGAEWWRRAAEQGYGIAQFNYGKALFYGIGVQQDLIRSRYWMTQSAQGGEEAALQFLTSQAEVFARIEIENDASVIAKTNSTDRQTASERSQNFSFTKQSQVIPRITVEKASQISEDNVVEVAAKSSTADEIVEVQVVEPPQVSFLKQSEKIPEIVSTETKLADNGNTIDIAAKSLTVDEFVSTENQQTKAKETSKPITSQSPKGTQLPNDNQWLYSHPTESVTWELFRMANRETAVRLFNTIQGQAQLFSSRSGRNRWYSILMGSFRSQADAKLSRDLLPDWVGWIGKPKVMSFGELQQNRCDISNQLDNDEALGLSKYCPPMRTQIASSEGFGKITKSTGKSNDNRWLFSNPTAAVTWELIRITDRKVALRLFDTVKNQAQLFSTRSERSRWYSILMGSFSNQVDAEYNRSLLPAWAGNAQVKPFGLLQKYRCVVIHELDNYEAQGLGKYCGI